MADPSLCFLFCFAVNALFYLSLIQISGDFLRLQSDSNLVEINFVMAVCSAFNRRYPSVCVMVLRWLGFRIMLACGLCKWNGSKMWKQLTAMMHHYYTQPLPNPISYYIHQCPKYVTSYGLSHSLSFTVKQVTCCFFQVFPPKKLCAFSWNISSSKFLFLSLSVPRRWMHASSVLMTFIVEGPLGFCIFGPSWSRYLAFIGFEAINLMINTTGNYGFIGALNMTVNMCFLDDSVIAVLPLPISIVDYIESMESISPLSVHWQWFEWITIPPTISLMALYVAASWIPFCSTSKRYILPFQSRSVCRLHEYFQRYRLVNRYAKFGSMHEGRYEFVVEGSANGKEWKEYSFLFKPSTATQIPAVVPLHIPQLDWMTWFLPLRWKRFGALQRTYYMHNAQGMSYTAPDWWYALERKLKENSEGILKVIKFNPFPIRGPKLIRTSVRQFEFVPWNERNDKESEDGARVWWKTKTVAVLRSRHAT